MNLEVYRRHLESVSQKIFLELVNTTISKQSTGSEIWLAIECTIATSRKEKKIQFCRP